MTILFDIMYIIMMTTTLSIIGLCSAGLTLAVTLYVVDKLLLRFVISNISNELLPPPPPPPPPTSSPGLVYARIIVIVMVDIKFRIAAFRKQFLDDDEFRDYGDFLRLANVEHIHFFTKQFLPNPQKLLGSAARPRKN
ncbi:hypothetical protein FRACYDRAFT_250896 [Fragilariopsis cylindrus CCMP1102]|uniref:Uncharacterized protein n=1 Tax=Fragilariopsis cylindrus CCMP1102 TaxID=635003 RepID=A0A1E7ENE5_9STRA|nr:hypothetical protein FRACYDRAFT_250896 [Fragilariopsis cylindrus CCMP1102]|eukprot:OEU07478.1 hypothetical protein FRACYDRAFT_250896 [Fragilariopsis cylindrus CCMP1102]